MPTKIIIPNGTRFGKLTVVKTTTRKNKFGFVLLECLCDCGNIRFLVSGALRSGNTKSCGCNHAASHVTHGMSRTVEYRVWRGIKERCLNPNSPQYFRYGGRGITMHGGWVDDFPAFFAHVGYRPKNTDSIERIDNNKGYEPGNVKWDSKKAQARNRRDNVLLTFHDETMTLIEWSERTGFSHAVLSQRIKRGMTVEQALTTPLMKIYKNKKGKHAERFTKVS